MGIDTLKVGKKLYIYDVIDPEIDSELDTELSGWIQNSVAGYRDI